MIYSFDIDGTLCELVDSPDRYLSAAPISGVVTLLRELHSAGHTIYLYTGRHMLRHEATVEWLSRNEIPYHHIFYGKPVADVYIDDRAVRFSGNVDDLRARLHE